MLAPQPEPGVACEAARAVAEPGRVPRPEILVFDVDEAARACEGLPVCARDAAFPGRSEREWWALGRIRAEHLDRVGAPHVLLASRAVQWRGTARLAGKSAEQHPQ